MNPPNAPAVTVVAAITAAITSTLGLLTFLGVDHQLVGGLILAANGWIAVGALLVHKRTTPTEQVALTIEEAKELRDAGLDPQDRGAIDIAELLLVVVIVLLVVLVLRAA